MAKTKETIEAGEFQLVSADNGEHRFVDEKANSHMVLRGLKEKTERGATYTLTLTRSDEPPTPETVVAEVPVADLPASAKVVKK